MMRLIGLGLILALWVGGGFPVFEAVAQTDAPTTPHAPTALVVTDDDVNAVARHLFCPVCESEPLHTCLAPTCFEWRAEIRAQLERGRTQQQIIDYFVAEAGQHVVGLPQDDGLRLLSIGAPIVIGVIALGVGLFTIRRWRGRSAPTAPTPPPPDDVQDDDYRARLERDLNDF